MISTDGPAATKPRASTVLLALSALIGFAANSLLCRAALLRSHSIDPATFTTVRLLSGAIALAVLVRIRSSSRVTSSGNWRSAIALFAYAIAFSLAYVRLTTGTGALQLFAVVQVTMIGGALRIGERLRPAQCLGLIIAGSGLVILCLPGVAAPDAVGAALMTCAGIAWGIYSLRGRRISNPLEETAGNFARAAPLAILASLIRLGSLHGSATGVLLAVASGALASGIGYSLWYAVVPRLTATRASILQLSVPVLAAVGGVAFLGETVSLRLVMAGLTTLSGVAISVLWRGRESKPA